MNSAVSGSISSRVVILRLVLVFIILAAVSQCSRDRCTEPEDYGDLPEILFAGTHYVTAWVHTYKGWYMDSAGTVSVFCTFSATADSLMAIEADGLIDLSELARLEQFAAKTDLVVDEDSLLTMSKLIRPASTGRLSKPTCECSDCGIWRYLGLMEDCRNAGYRTVVLYQGGEERRTNASPEADRLYKWLERTIDVLVCP